MLESAADIEVVAEADNGLTAVQRAVSHRADVALVDLKMPGLDGFGVVEQLRSQAPALRIVVLTSFGDEPNVLRALRHGAAGFLLKNCTPDELIPAVRAAHAGDAFLSPAVTRLVVNLVRPDQTQRRSDAAERLAGLSPRERQIVGLVAQGLPNAEIARRLRMSEPTVKTYVSRILTKLGCANRVQAALLVRDAG